MRHLLLISLALISCQGSDDSIVGDWKVASKFHQSTCRIEKDGEYFNGLALSYNDGTTFYTYNENQPRYFFRNLQKNDTLFVDGISGATSSSADATGQINIYLVSRDTLKMMTKVSNTLIEEIWIRK